MTTLTPENSKKKKQIGFINKVMNKKALNQLLSQVYLDFGGAYIPHCQTPYTISLKFMYFIYWKLNINNNNISLRIATYKIIK